MKVQTPDWVKDAIFYQIFPDRFAFSEKLRPEKPRNLEPWDAPPTPYGYKGGDLLGVLERLDWIQDLGATAIYFTPIFQSASNHRYHTHDYYRVDPLLGGDAAFQRLLDEAHRRGLRVVLDGVFNHCSRGFFQFNDILENGRFSPYLDWFTLKEEFPINAYDAARAPGYGAWRSLHALPKFNTDNSQVREFLMRVGEYWLRRGIDGWRLDVPRDITTEGFWEEFRQRVKAINPEAYIVGEIWREAVEFLHGDRFDGVMNYLFAGAAISYAAGPRVDETMAHERSYQPALNYSAQAYADRIDWLLDLYPWEIQLTQMNLLDSHDSARVITLARGDASSAHLATILLLTYPGAVSVYYGDEIGLEGGLPDHDTRRTFPWDRPGLWNQEVLAYHKALIALRKAHPALSRGSYHRLYADESVYVFGRRLGDDVLCVAVNAAVEPRSARSPAGELFEDGAALRPLYGEHEGLRVEAGEIHLSLPGRSGVIFCENGA
jgi:glycosidase